MYLEGLHLTSFSSSGITLVAVDIAFYLKDNLVSVIPTTPNLVSISIKNRKLLFFGNVWLKIKSTTFKIANFRMSL